MFDKKGLISSESCSDENAVATGDEAVGDRKISAHKANSSTGIATGARVSLNYSQNQKSLPAETVPCLVCQWSDYSNDNPLIKRTGCDTFCHQQCITSPPRPYHHTRSWTCEKCLRTSGAAGGGSKTIDWHDAINYAAQRFQKTIEGMVTEAKKRCRDASIGNNQAS